MKATPIATAVWTLYGRYPLVMRVPPQFLVPFMKYAPKA